MLFFAISCQCQKQDTEADIAAINELYNQYCIMANAGDIEGFMEGYIKSDDLKFVGSKGITYGWKQTLENYKRFPKSVF